jgi:hypothetical protein
VLVRNRKDQVDFVHRSHNLEGRIIRTASLRACGRSLTWLSPIRRSCGRSLGWRSRRLLRSNPHGRSEAEDANQCGRGKQLSAHGKFHSINSPRPIRQSTPNPIPESGLSTAPETPQAPPAEADFNCTSFPVAGCANSNSAECRKLRPSSSTSRAALRVTLNGSAIIFAGAPYSVSPTTGCEIEAICTRIWCVRPVSMRTRASVKGPKRVSSRSTTR